MHLIEMDAVAEEKERQTRPQNTLISVSILFYMILSYNHITIQYYLMIIVLFPIYKIFWSCIKGFSCILLCSVKK